MDAHTVSVAVVGICGAAHLERCLEALASQRGAPEFELLVVYDPHLRDMDALQAKWPAVRMLANEGQRTPLELASAAIRESSGDLVLLTEDHCIPRPDWVREILAGLEAGRAAVGGGVDTDPDARPLDWAFYFVDFFRYARLGGEGPSATLTVCCVGYRRRDLEEIEPLWQEVFHETAINDALRRRFGDLWLRPSARVRMRRQVTLRDALYERYAFGRLFGCTRLDFMHRAMRWLYLPGSLLLPPLLLGRMAAAALPVPGLRSPFLRALPPLLALVLAWSLGEALGYLTRRRPKVLTVAPERDSAAV